MGASFITSASFVTTASYVDYVVSASYVNTASFVISASNITTASFAISSSRAVSASFATSSSYALSSSFATSATSASFAVSSSRAVSASFTQTAAIANVAIKLGTTNTATNTVNFGPLSKVGQSIPGGTIVSNAAGTVDLSTLGTAAGGWPGLVLPTSFPTAPVAGSVCVLPYINDSVELYIYDGADWRVIILS
jgi:hypothetical protein